jgi:hypothetical protein
MARRAWLLMAMALLGAVAAPVMAQDANVPTTASAGVPSPTDQERAMAAWDRASAPGPWHGFLAQRVGKWRVAGRVWNDPAGEPSVSKGEAQLEMILGGRILQEHLRGSSGKLQFEGEGLLACDNSAGTLTWVWVDSMGTMMSVLTGRAGEVGKPVELHGQLTDPASGRIIKLRVVLTFVGPDEFRWEYFGAPEGYDEARMMEMVYTRGR